MRARLRAWSALLRVPNLPTVPGDPIAGALLAMSDRAISGSPPWTVVLSAVVLYAAGLIDNDLADFDEDSKSRPERPLPSGAVLLRQARVARFTLFALGLVSAATAGLRPLAVAISILLLSIAYNHGLKRNRFTGPWAMGVCRGLSLLMGAAAVAPDVLGGGRTVAGFVVLTAGIAFVTWFARDETGVPGRPATVGRMIGALPLLQAVFVLASGHPSSPWIASALVALAIMSALLRRSFSAS